MLFIFTPCRASFCLFVAIAFAVNADHASHITVGEPPRTVSLRQPQENLQ